MDLTHFGLCHRPFRPTPDGAAYYPAGTHEAALAQLQQGIAGDEGLMLLTGEPGTGKTLVGQRLLERLPPDTAAVLIPNGHLRHRADLLQALLYDLGQPYRGLGEQELRLSLTDHLLETYRAGRRTVVVLDEAHHLSPDLLEELRLLGNLESRQGKALQIVLLAQPSILETLRKPELTACRQRLAVKARLEPLPPDEAADYVLHQLRCAGGKADSLFTGEALSVLAHSTGGLPRLLNQAAAQAMLLTAQADRYRVDAEAALEALGLLGIEPSPEADAGQSFTPPRAEGDEPADEFHRPAVVALPHVTTAEATDGVGCEPAWPSNAYVVQQPGRPPTLIYAPGRPA
jgi:type II secretory pathway predicted ATPase ExeA